MAPERVFLGSACELGAVPVTGHVTIDCKLGLKEDIADEMEHVVYINRLEPAHAGKIRGKVNWAASNSYGECAKLGTYQLKGRQYSLEGDCGPGMDAEMGDGCLFVAHIMRGIGPRSIQV